MLRCHPRPEAAAMSTRRILLLQAHPDHSHWHFCHALGAAYAEAATAAGHTVRSIEIARLQFPLLHGKHEFEQGPVPPGLMDAQQALAWAEHVVVLFPLWLGTLPALLKAFLERVLRPGFAFKPGPGGRMEAGLKGRSVRLVVTMGMPALVYRWYFRSHGIKSLVRNVLGFVGFAPVRTTLIGNVEAPSPAARERWLKRIAGFGRDAL